MIANWARRSAHLFMAFAVGAAVMLDAARSTAVPQVGSAAANVVFRDAWERTNELARYRGMPVLVVYEDKDSVEVNKVLKKELAQLAQGDRYKSRIALFAVADVTGYDYWPVRGFVKDAIQKESRRQKTVIYCDWDGSIRTALRLNRNASNVVLYDKDGAVVFSQAGTLSLEERRALIGRLRAALE